GDGRNCCSMAWVEPVCGTIDFTACARFNIRSEALVSVIESQRGLARRGLVPDVEYLARSVREEEISMMVVDSSIDDSNHDSRSIHRISVCIFHCIPYLVSQYVWDAFVQLSG